MRRILASLLLALAVTALPQAAAGFLVWTFVVLPLTVTAGQATVFTMTVTNVAGPDDLGCTEVTLPAGFSVQSISDPVASNGGDWEASLTGTTVEVNTDSGGDRLEIGDSVTFQVKATPPAAGLTSWPNHAHRQQDCSGPTELGLPIEVVVLPPILATPTPRPTATPTPKPTPTAHPTPRPTPAPTRPPASAAPPSTSSPTPAPNRSSSPRPRPSASASEPPAASPTPDGAGPVQSPPGGGSGSGQITDPRIPPDPAPVRVGAGTLTVFDGIGTWSVPAAVVGVPGLLVVLWVALQTVGALAWVPAVRRLRGEDRPREA
jgi:hypothetical protein